MSDNFLIYGSYGYTAELILELALKEGKRPVLAGRDAVKLAQQAKKLGLEYRAFSLDDPQAVDAGLAGMKLVLNCAGPFARTAKPMVAGCLRNACHYLDITGELSVFETLAAQDRAAKEAGVMLLPGTGFDVVPTDCLAAHLKSRLPDATHLVLAFQGLGGLSRGTATTMIENIDQGGAVRQNGVITRVPAAWKTRTIDFGTGPNLTVTIPWGDVSTAYHSTGIGNIEVYTAAPASAVRRMRLSRYLGWLLKTRPVQNYLKGKIQAGPPGPNEARRSKAISLVWGEARNAAGKTVGARLRTPNGYTLTALTAYDAAKRSLAGEARPGFQTPSRAFGKDYILGFDGVSREDLT